MGNKILHITNGDGLTEKMSHLHLSGQVISWREMLCEGKTVQEVGSKEFIATRKHFLNEHYQITAEDYELKFVAELEKLTTVKDYEAIILWFEFDLFCHINMIALISFLFQQNIQKPIYLVCSKRLKGEEKLQGLSQLNDKELQNHFDHKILLNIDDLELAELVWKLYCGNNPLRLKSEIKKSSNFEYLSSCLRAHIERFPNVKSGLNTLEANILKLVATQQISSQNQFLGYSLEYQGYYGYGDEQMLRIINNLKAFIYFDNKKFALTEEGKMALNKSQNFYQELKDNLYYGGAKKYDFLYDDESHHLLKL
ncbi:DUF1835 domain-containing protein [Mesonia aestuariivivens]|uniref:DUF1835 domain-containing protein n=1 Tax=Mesonia aestuariivivens TaxID=2796128 RepID=A0ABS6W0V1_9FLAO|nr:DUF1835 domain-containing protein [Mesonia aestuariivivens]MBW2960778.1 DUF1835 domain-containing protein [Mesonia aestuariivivens]